MGCRFLFQGIFMTERPNPRFLYLLHWQVDSLLLLHLNLTARCDTSQLSLINVLTYIVIVFIPWTKKKNWHCRMVWKWTSHIRLFLPELARQLESSISFLLSHFSPKEPQILSYCFSSIKYLMSICYKIYTSRGMVKRGCMYGERWGSHCSFFSHSEMW